MYKTTQTLALLAPKAFGLEYYHYDVIINGLQIRMKDLATENIELGLKYGQLYEQVAELANYLIAHWPGFMKGKEGQSFPEIAVQLIQHLAKECKLHGEISEDIPTPDSLGEDERKT
jgi:hypothetical protein